MKNFTPAEERAETERLARLASRAIHALDPETLILADEPTKMRGFWYVGSGGLVPLWTLYIGVGKAMFDDQRRQEEIQEFTKGDGSVDEQAALSTHFR